MIGLTHPTDLLLLCSAVALLAMLLSLLMNHLFTGWDARILQSFSRVTQSPRWFFAWVLVFLAWIPIRSLLIEHVKWFAGDGDLILLTVLWSVVPYMVENAMKYSAARQMDELQKQSEHIVKQNAAIVDLTTAIRAALDRLQEGDEFIRELLQRLLNAIEEDGTA